MRILVTGALGFVGINLVRCFASQPGVHVIASDTASMSYASGAFLKSATKQFDYAELDICDRAAVQALLAARDITHVVHAAALTLEDTVANASRVVAVNLGGSINLLDAILSSETVERAILVSSSGVYGPAVHVTEKLQRESGLLELSTLYAITKRSAELLSARYSILCGKPIIAVRLSAVYGPMEQTKLSRPLTSVFHYLMNALRAGTHVCVDGPGIVRDWTYTADIAEGIWALLGAREWRHPVYNLSCGEASTFREVVQAFADLGLRVSWADGHDVADISMYPHQARMPLDIARLISDTGFSPRFKLCSGLKDWLINEPLPAN